MVVLREGATSESDLAIVRTELQLADLATLKQLTQRQR
jgi:hypothetical protein